MYSDIPSFILKKDCIEEKFTLLSKQNEKYSIKLQKKNGSQYEVFFYENTKLKYNRLIFLSKSQDIYAKKSDNHVFKTNEIESIFDNIQNIVPRNIQTIIDNCKKLILKDC